MTTSTDNTINLKASGMYYEPDMEMHMDVIRFRKVLSDMKQTLTPIEIAVLNRMLGFSKSPARVFAKDNDINLHRVYNIERSLKKRLSTIMSV